MNDNFAYDESTYQNGDYQSQFETNFGAAEAEKRSERRTAIFIILTSLFVIGYIIHLVNWDKYHLAIIPLKLKQVVGSSRAEDLRSVADICIERRKYSCAIDALTKLATINPNAADEYKLGELLRKTGATQYAVMAYTSAISLQKGVKPLNANMLSDSYYGLAKSYEKLGQLSSATANYELALNAKPDVIQITVADAYVQLLRNMGKNSAADALVKKIKVEGGSLPSRAPASI